MGLVGRVEGRPGGGGVRIAVDLGPLAEGLAVGDSVAVSGCCLTVVERAGTIAEFDAIPETIERTWFRDLAAGQDVNLERPLRAGDRLDGHIVQGHVDGTARVAAREARGGLPRARGRHKPPKAAMSGGIAEVRLDFECEPRLTDDMVEKGSVALDGVSLTLTSVARGRFGVALIPHTLAVTTLGRRAAGDRLNVETDVIGKWVRRLATPYLAR